MFTRGVTHASFINIWTLEKLDTLHFLTVIYRPGFIDVNILRPFLLELTGLWWLLVFNLGGPLILKQLYEGVVRHVFPGICHVLTMLFYIVIFVFLIFTIKGLLLVLVDSRTVCICIHILHVGEASIPEVLHHILSIFTRTVRKLLQWHSRPLLLIYIFVFLFFFLTARFTVWVLNNVYIWLAVSSDVELGAEEFLSSLYTPDSHGFCIRAWLWASSGSASGRHIVMQLAHNIRILLFIFVAMFAHQILKVLCIVLLLRFANRRDGFLLRRAFDLLFSKEFALVGLWAKHIVFLNFRWFCVSIVVVAFEVWNRWSHYRLLLLGVNHLEHTRSLVQVTQLVDPLFILPHILLVQFCCQIS